MKAIVLSAGQGRRLLPLTDREPKCLLEVDGPRTVLELQLRALARCGIRQVTVVLGFGAERVEGFLETLRIPNLHVETLFNPFFASSDNLATCWLARPAMSGGGAELPANGLRTTFAPFDRGHDGACPSSA
jgi:choline kinase